MEPTRFIWTRHDEIIDEVPNMAFVESLSRVQQETSFLAEANDPMQEPDFVLKLATEIEFHEADSNGVAGITLTIYPAFERIDAACRAKLETPEGESLSEFTARGEERRIIQILLLPLLPVFLVQRPDRAFFDDTLRDIMIQLGMYLEQHPMGAKSANP